MSGGVLVTKHMAGHHRRNEWRRANDINIFLNQHSLHSNFLILTLHQRTARQVGVNFYKTMFDFKTLRIYFYGHKV